MFQLVSMYWHKYGFTRMGLNWARHSWFKCCFKQCTTSSPFWPGSARHQSHHHSPIHRIQPPPSPPKQHLAFSPRWHKKRGWRCVSHVDDEVLLSNSWLHRCRSLPPPHPPKKNETAPFPTSVMEMLGWSQVLFKASKPFTPRPWLWKDNYRGWWISTSMCKCSLLWLFPKYSVNYRNLRRLLIKYIKYVKYKEVAK